MITKAQELSKRAQSLNEEIIAFIKAVPDGSWRNQCKGELWSIGVVARHIGVSHYGIIDLSKMMIAGTPIPVGMERQIAKSNAAHADKHADCSREEVLSILKENGAKIVDYIAGLSDTALDTRADIPDFGGEITVKQLFKSVILRSGGEHLESMRKSLAQS